MPKICPNIKGQSVKQELKKDDFTKALKLTDANMSSECSVDVNWIRYILGLSRWRNKT